MGLLVIRAVLDQLSLKPEHRFQVLRILIERTLNGIGYTLLDGRQDSIIAGRPVIAAQARGDMDDDHSSTFSTSKLYMLSAIGPVMRPNQVILAHPAHAIKPYLAKVEDNDAEPLLLQGIDLAKSAQRFVMREAGQHLLNILTLKHLFEAAVPAHLTHATNNMVCA